MSVVNLASMEHVVRWLIQMKVAIERSPRHPDFAELDEVMGGPVTAAGNARVSRFMQHVSEKQRERSQILEQTRLYTEKS